MRIKGLFTVPEGKKITEKLLGRVLASSVCGMLLCMACLAGTTWAWFATTVENTDNVIQTAAAPSYTLLVDGQAFTSGGTLPANEHGIQITHNSEADDLQQKSKLYVTFMIDDTPYGYVILGGDQPSSVIVILENKDACTLSWTVSWFAPGNPDIKQLTDNVIRVLPGEEEEEEEETTEPSDATEPSSEATEPSSEATEPSSEATEPSSEATEPSSEATEPSSEATEPSSEATEPSSEATEPSSEATEPSSEATEPSSEATEPSSEATEPSSEPAASEPDPSQSES